MTLQVFSGSVIVVTYGQTILENIQDVQLQDAHTGIVLATVHLISYLVCISLVDRLGRKPLMVISTVGVCSCSFLLASYFYVQEFTMKNMNLQSLIYLTALFYMVSVSLGLTSLPFLVTNEIFPIYAKTTCVGLCFCINFVWSFVVLRVWSIIMFKRNAYSVALWFVSGLNLFSIFFLIFYFPETKKVSLLHIRKNFIERTK